MTVLKIAYWSFVITILYIATIFQLGTNVWPSIFDGSTKSVLTFTALEEVMKTGSSILLSAAFSYSPAPIIFAIVFSTVENTGKIASGPVLYAIIGSVASTTLHILLAFNTIQTYEKSNAAKMSMLSVNVVLHLLYNLIIIRTRSLF